jgi:hypothetical protein
VIERLLAAGIIGKRAIAQGRGHIHQIHVGPRCVCDEVDSVGKIIVTIFISVCNVRGATSAR